MNYVLTEPEYYQLDSVRGQLNLVAGLLSAKGANSSLYDASDLNEFLAAQTDTLKAVTSSVDARYEACNDRGNVMHWTDWSRIIGVVSGRDTMTGGQLKDMTRKLQRCVQADPDMQHVLSAWMDVMTQGETLPFTLEPTSTDGFNIQFEPLAPVVKNTPDTDCVTVTKQRLTPGRKTKPDKQAE